MKYILLLITIIICGCDTSLSEKERRSLKEEMQQREIKKISEDDIVAETFEQGKKLVKEYETGSDSLLNNMNASIAKLGVKDSTANETYWKLLDAYKYSLTQGGPLSDNVQRDNEFLIYTVPYLEKGEFAGIYIVRISKKEIVLAM